MKVIKVENTREKRILTALIVNDTVCGRIASKWPEHAQGLFKTQEANQIGSWCILYYKQYQQAPNKAIYPLFQQWAENSKDRETISYIERFLQTLAEEHELNEEINAEYVLDLAGSYFNEVSALRLSQDIQRLIDNHQPDKAISLISKFNQVGLAPGDAIDLFQDREFIYSIFDETRQKPIIEFPGSLGYFFDRAFVRGGFVAYQASEKAGKSWHLIDLAYRAMCQRKKVAFFSVGDMTEPEVGERFVIRAARHPIHSKHNQWPCKLKIPQTIKVDRSDWTPIIQWNEEKFDSPLTREDGWLALQAVMKDRVKSNNSYLKLSCHPNSTINVSGIKSIIQQWELEGYYCDICIIDYADILAPPIGTSKEERDQINTTWKQLRALSQEKNILVVTATQSDAAAYDKRLQTRSNFSGDHRKHAHVTATIAINQDADEKENCCGRLNMVQYRAGDFSSLRCCYYAGNLYIGNPMIVSAI